MATSAQSPSYWESTKTFKLRVGTTFGTHPMFLALSVIGYLLSLNFLVRWMQSRSPIKFHTFTLIHNFCLAGLSLVTALGIIYEILYTPYPASIRTSRIAYYLFPPHGTELTGRLYWWCYIYHLSKFIEFIDTWLIILRKAQKGLTFLHVIHHSSMAINVVSWFVADYGAMWLPAMMNSFVHVVMYLYYAFCSMGIRSPFKSWITILQLIQFSIGILYVVIFVIGRIFFDLNATGNILIVGTNGALAVFFFYLFQDFYQKSYCPSKKEAAIVREKPEEGKTD